MNSHDHPPPHFHARYAEDQASIRIATGQIIAGNLPARALRLIEEWRELHLAELEENWRRSEADLPVLAIEPL